MGRLTAGCCFALLLVVAVVAGGWFSQSLGSSDEGRRELEKAWWDRFRQLTFAHDSAFAQLPPDMQRAAEALLSRKHSGALHPDDIEGVYRGRWQTAHIGRADDVSSLDGSTQPDDGSMPPADAATGSLALTLRTQPSARKAVWLVRGTARLYGATGGYEAALGVQGLYWSANGTAVLYAAPEISTQTTVDVVLGAPNAEVFAEAQAVYEESLGGRLLSYTPPEDARRGCGYHFYARLGQAHGGLRIETALASPNCGALVTTPSGQPAAGIGAKAYGSKATRYALTALAVMLLQSVLTARQMQHTSTPAGLSLVSYQALAVQVVLDCYAFITNVLAAMSLDRLRLVYTAAAILAYTLAMAPPMHYVTIVWHTQRPAAAAAALTGRSGSSAVHGDLWRVYLKFYAMLVPGVYAIYAFVDTRTVFSGWLLAVLLAAAYSYWIPQIWRNAVVGSARGLRLRYVCGTTLARLVLPLYFLACPSNIALVAPSPLVWLLAAFSLAQAVTLVLQRMLGPRFFIPPALRPAVHDYQSALPPADDGQPGDLESGACDAQSAHTCAICLHPVGGPAPPESPAPEAAPETEPEPEPAHAITPCKHVYHKACLARWMEIKLECPICRALLPPVQDL